MYLLSRFIVPINKIFVINLLFFITFDKKIYMPNLYIIAGCNGAGKTTASYTILPEMLNCKEFINADEIARGLSPFQQEKAAIDAGKIMLTRIKELIKLQVDFSFETTLSARHLISEGFLNNENEVKEKIIWNKIKLQANEK